MLSASGGEPTCCCWAKDGLALNTKAGAAQDSTKPTAMCRITILPEIIVFCSPRPEGLARRARRIKDGHNRNVSYLAILRDAPALTRGVPCGRGSRIAGS